MILLLKAATGARARPQSLARRLRCFALRKPGLITNLLAIVALFSVGIV